MNNPSIRKYNGIDVLKFLCAVLVIIIHVPPFREGSRFAYPYFILRNCFARVAVPFFFVSGSFFLFRKCDPENPDFAPAARYLKRIFRMYVIWSAVYLPLQILQMHTEGIFGFACIAEYIKDFLFVGTYYHLWYLHAAIVATALTYFCYRKFGASRTLVLAGVLYAIGLLGQSWYGLIRPLYGFPIFSRSIYVLGQVFESTRNGLLDGFLFVVIGMLFAFGKIRISLPKALLGGFLSVIALFAEFYISFRLGMALSYDMFLFLVPVVLFLFAAAMALPLGDSPVYGFLRRCSTWMFLIHFLVWEIVKFIFGLWVNAYTYTTAIFFLTLILTIAISAGIAALSRRRQRKAVRSGEASN